MKRFIQEEYAFTLTVLGGKTNAAGALDCRNGHEPGDQYVCEYGCPQNLCPKCLIKAFPLMEAVRTGGDLRNLGGDHPRRIAFCCPDGVVTFQLEATQKDSLG